MIDVQALKRSRQAKIDEMNTILAGAEKRDGKTLTDDERSKRTELMNEARNLGEEITAAEFSNEEESRDLVQNPKQKKEGDEETRNWTGFVDAVLRGDTANLETREMSMGVGKKGGVLIPSEYETEIRAIQPEDNVVRPNALVIPASGDSPDAALEIPTLDQTGDKGVFGNLVFNWTGETGKKKNAGDVEFIMVTLEPNNVTGYCEVTNKLMANRASFASYLQQIMAGAISSLEDFVFYLGDGNGKPKGILNSKAVIKINRTALGKINYKDLTAMNAVVKGTNLKWVMNRTALPELQEMVADGTTSLVWQAGLVPGAPDTILGLPVLYNEHSPVLGEFGDIALLDMKQYAIKDGTGLSIFIDETTQFENGKTRIYISISVDGQSLTADSILSEDKKTRRSPFVALNK